MKTQQQTAMPTGTPRDSKTESLWQHGIEKLKHTNSEHFNLDTVYDALIIGGGITGLTTALLLQKAGKNCVLAEAYSIGYGTTGGTTAHINTYVDTTYDQIQKDFGEEGAQLTAEAVKEAIALINELVTLHQIKCGFEYKPGYLYAETEEETSRLINIFEASVKAGVSVHSCTMLPIPPAFKKAIVFEGQAQFHPLKYIHGLAEEFVRLGGIVLENTFIREHQPEKNYHTAQSDTLSIKAVKIVYATHIPPGINLLHFRNAPYRSYAIGIKLPEDRYPDALVYDMQEPYHYFRTQQLEDEKFLILGGEDHKTGHGDPESSFRRLEDYARQLYPQSEIIYRWSSQYYEPADGLPYIGKLPSFGNGIFTATGFSGNGITYGSISGKILCDLVLGQPNKYEKLFSPERIKPIAGFAEFVKENADAAYRFINDRFTADEIDPFLELGRDAGAVIEFNKKQLAVYKDAAGEIHALNPVCRHAGCIVNWNNAEKSWDCPCHGARYDMEGRVLTGPARHDLQKVIIEKS